MTTADLLQETFGALRSNKVRSGLTMLGIIIGISSVIALVAIGAGAQASIQNSIQSLGSNLVQVTPGAQRQFGAGVSLGRGSAQTLTQADAEAIAAQVTEASAVTSEVSGRYQVVAKGMNTNTSVDGVTDTYPAVRNIQIDEGTFVSAENNKNLAKVAVLGPTARDDLFGVGAEAVGQTIKIKNVEFKVVGITAAKGGTGFGSQDTMIFIPLSTAQHYLSGSQFISTISVQASSAGAMTQMQADITSLLLARHNIADPTQADFSTLNQADIVASASTITDTLTYLLAAVAGISLVVGGIGIMNMMLTTVTERTREIGLRKAIGAKRSDINKQFLIEAIMLTGIGGLVGITIGWSISFGITYLGILQTSVSFSSVALAFGVSAGIGIVFGYYPARRAAALNPIEALRYE